MKVRSVVGRVSLLAMLLALVLCADPFLAGAGDYPTGPAADFDWDYYADLAIGVPYDHPAGVSDAGAVNVAYGGSTGLSKSSAQHWRQDFPGSADSIEQDDHFGYALAVGDFDGDGHFDLAVGVPGQTVGGELAAGAVHVLYGAPTGVYWEGDQVWHQDVGSMQSLAEEGDEFGKVLATGDFNRDGYDDLAVGVPFEDWNEENAGIVQILYGSPTGLDDLLNQLYRQGFGGLPDEEDAWDQFGGSLAVGDFDGDGWADLAIGAPTEGILDQYYFSEAGVVHVLYGGPGGLTTTGNLLLHQNVPDMEDEVEPGDNFGEALASGDFDGDGYDDLAVDVFQEDGGAGAVHIVGGSSGGLDPTNNRLIRNWLNGDLSMSGFGYALAAGDFDGDGLSDLAVGVPYYDLLYDVDFDCGGSVVYYGSDDNFFGPAAQLWVQNSAWGLCGGPELDDYFGKSLAAGDFDGDGFSDLAIGVPNEDLDYMGATKADAGCVHIAYGSVDQLSAANVQSWYQDGILVEDAPGDGEQFGRALAAHPAPFHRIYLPMLLQEY